MRLSMLTEVGVRKMTATKLQCRIHDIKVTGIFCLDYCGAQNTCQAIRHEFATHNTWLDSIFGSQLETYTNLLPGYWSTLAASVIQTNRENVVVQPFDLQKRFYRLVQP